MIVTYESPRIILGSIKLHGALLFFKIKRSSNFEILLKLSILYVLQ